jgi:predicted DNA-binding transcriptional regulator YafY
MQGDVLRKAFAAVNLFQTKSRGLTAIELSQELNISVRSAYYYLQELALHFPIAKNYASPARYRLMERR